MGGIVTFERIGQHGRLGNQLFQVAATLAYADLTKKTAVFPVRYQQESRWDYYFENTLNFEGQFTIEHQYIEASYTYQPIPSFDRNVDLYGYFQSEKYFFFCTENIRGYLTPSILVEKQLRERWAKELNQTTCSVHIRRTDYLKSPHIYPICQPDYYLSAIEMMKRENGVNRFLVFGDDLPWAKSFMLGDEYTFIEGQLPIEDLFLMSFCEHNIIANSSFSWWGSWLNSNPEKVVIAPRKWILNENAKDVYCNTWTVL